MHILSAHTSKSPAYVGSAQLLVWPQVCQFMFLDVQKLPSQAYTHTITLCRCLSHCLIALQVVGAAVLLLVARKRSILVPSPLSICRVQRHTCAA